MTTPLSAIQTDDPYPYYARLTDERPFAFDEEIGAWTAADASTVNAAFTGAGLGVRPEGNDVPAPIVGTPAGEVFGDLVRMRDDRAAAELKSALVTALAKTGPADIADAARRRAREALETGLDYGELAFGVPVATVATLCGIAESDTRTAVGLTAAFVRCVPASATPEDYTAAAEAAAELRPLLARAADSGTGLAARLVETALAHRADAAAAVSNAVGLLSQTYDATAGLVGNAFTALSRHDRGPDLRAFVEEVARHDAPIQNTRRFARRTWSHAGQTVEPGQTILLVLAAANRDPAANTDPHAFDPERPHPVSFTFGAGRHGCPGRAVAVEIAAAIIAEAEAAGWTPGDLPERHRYLPSPNARIPCSTGAAHDRPAPVAARRNPPRRGPHPAHPRRDRRPHRARRHRHRRERADALPPDRGLPEGRRARGRPRLLDRRPRRCLRARPQGAPRRGRPLTGRHLYFAHAYKGQHGSGPLLARFAAGGGEILDLEYLTDERGRRLAAFGHWAGYVGAALAVRHWNGDLDRTLTPSTKDRLDATLREPARRPRVLVVGALGRCGRGALGALERAGITPTLWDMAETARLDRDAILDHDILINAVGVTGPAQILLGTEHLRPGHRLSLIVDVTCDVGSPFHLLPVYDRLTTWDEPVRAAADGLAVIAIDNLPSLLPREASDDFSGQLAPHLRLLPDGDCWERSRTAFRTALRDKEMDHV
ncbi:hypothetical protein GCM10029992_25040 [Glycomyces albus]